MLRGLVKKYGARPTHEGAETILTDLAEHLDDYSAELARVMDPVWAREYRWVARFQGRPEYDWGEAAQPEEAARKMGEPESYPQGHRPWDEEPSPRRVAAGLQGAMGRL